MTRPARVYRLDITYPVDSRPTDPGFDHRDGWAPDDPAMADVDHLEPETGAPVYRHETFRWPAERRFLTRSGAETRARKLRGWGCTVTVQPSRPIEWDEATEETPCTTARS